MQRGQKNTQNSPTLRNMVASAMHILDARGKVLISRDYRGEVPLSVAQSFASRLDEFDESTQNPVFTDTDGITYTCTRHDSIILLSTSVTRNFNSFMLVLFHTHVCKLLTSSIGFLTTERIRDNFIMIHELLDDAMDFGYPQNTDENDLKAFLTQPGFKFDPPVRASGCTLGQHYYQNAVYKKNETFVDLVEKLCLLVSSDGQVLRSEIQGSLSMKCYLSGIPFVKLGLNEKVTSLTDIHFDQCVRLDRFENDRVVAFIPPGEEVLLMTYRVNLDVKPLILAELVVKSRSRNKIEFCVKARSQFKKKNMRASKVEIWIPIPEDVDSYVFTAYSGNVKYVPEKNCAVWTVNNIMDGQEFELNAQVGLPSTSKLEEVELCWKRPLEVRFEIPYFTLSSLSVKYLKIKERPGYQALSWVRYCSMAGPKDYLLRIKA